MEQRAWYFQKGQQREIYNVLFNDNNIILVQNDRTKSFSFGAERDFGTLFGFGVNESCLNFEQCKKRLLDFANIAKKRHKNYWITLITVLNCYNQNYASGN